MSKQKNKDKKEKKKKEKKKQNLLYKETKFIKNVDIDLELKKYFKKTKQIDDAIDNNLKILEALEEEYRQNMEKRKNLSEELEAEGYHSLEEKLEAIRQQCLEHAGKKLNFD